MSADPLFKGFSPKTIAFFEDLAKNNNREWFEHHRDVYDNEVLTPAKIFVTTLGSRLKTILPRIVAVPKINKSIFRINRDTRFSPDKSPYKTNLGLYFWEGPRPRMESTGFYVHLEPPNLMLGGGMYMFPDRLIDRYRKAVIDPKRGAELAKILKAALAVKEFTLGGAHYKRVPAGYDPGHPRTGLLLHNGLYIGSEGPVPEEFYSAKFVDYCFERFKRFVPLHRWIVSMLG
jgi:uncharacterized protein (TIGR02453 family)